MPDISISVVRLNLIVIDEINNYQLTNHIVLQKITETNQKNLSLKVFILFTDYKRIQWWL